MFKYKFSKREKVLVGGLIVVVVILLWYLFVFQRTNEDISRINSEISNIQQENVVNEQMIANMKNMQESIDKHKARGDSTITIPTYDNIKPLMAELDGVLGATTTYSIAFDDLDLSSSEYVLRPVKITFGCDSYETVEGVANALAKGGFPCVISELSFTDNTNTGTSRAVNSSTGNNANFSATLTAIFFENFNDELLAQKRAEDEAEAAAQEAAEA